MSAAPRAPESAPPSSPISRCSVEMYSSLSRSASWPARGRRREGGRQVLLAWRRAPPGRRSSAASGRPRGARRRSAPARSSTGATTPSRASSRASRRCTGSIAWWPRSAARAEAAASASCARTVGLSTAMRLSSLLRSRSVCIGGRAPAGGDHPRPARRPAGTGGRPRAPGGRPRPGAPVSARGLEPALGALQARSRSSTRSMPARLRPASDSSWMRRSRATSASEYRRVLRAVRLGRDQPAALVEAQGLGVHPGQLGGDADHANSGRRSGRPSKRALTEQRLARVPLVEVCEALERLALGLAEVARHVDAAAGR